MADQTEPALPRAIALAWGVAASPQRGPKRELSIERIIETAVRVADADGLGAVSMARVAQELGFTTMSLYRYVTSKDDLLALMQDEVAGFEQPAVTGEDWRGELRTWARLALAQLTPHPWFTDVPITSIPLMPNQLRMLDTGLATLQRTPLSGSEKLASVLAIVTHVRTVASYAQQSAASGVPPEEWSGAAFVDTMRELLDPAAYPQVVALLEAGAFAGGDFDEADYGLERILDGIAAYIAAKATGADEPVAAADPDLEHYAKDQKVKEAAQRRREAEKALREAQKHEREALKDARERAKNAAERERSRAERAARHS